VNGWWVELGRFERTVDASGLHGRITGPRGGVSELTFDAAGCYPVRVRDTLGNEIQAEFDLRVYQATSVTEPYGARSTARFDALARLLHKVEPGDSEAEPTIAYAYDTSSLPLQVTVSYRTSAATPRRVERQFIDGSGRLLERRVKDALGEVIESCNVFGPRGVLVRTHLPRRPAGPAYAAPGPGDAHMTIVYDALGRAVRTVRPRRRRGQHALPARRGRTAPTRRTTVTTPRRNTRARSRAGSSMPPGGSPASRSGWARRCSRRPTPTTSRAG
jgi:hypothetical protein